jgi:ribose transport system substrate-binding protein
MPVSHARRAVTVTGGLLATAILAACTTGTSSTATTSAAGSPGTGAGTSSCPSVAATAKAAVATASNVTAPWTGPTTGPTAAKDKLIVYVAQTMTNPGVAGAAKGVQDSAAAIGWKVRIIDGQGTPAGISSAFSQAIALNPAGIVLSGFDPATTGAQVKQANAAGIPLIGWHAESNPGPSTDPKLFTNVTTRVQDVAQISADWIITHSGGDAGVVVFTDNSIPFAAGKAKMLESDLTACSGIKVLQVANIPIADAEAREPQEFSSLATSLGSHWTYSVAINDLYFDQAAAPLRAAGDSGDGAPYNVGAGDGSAAAFQRIASGQFQAVTVPEPLEQEGWQIIDEFNRAFHNMAPSGYVPPVHITDAANVGDSTSWDPQNGYQSTYKKIWGV